MAKKLLDSANLESEKELNFLKEKSNEISNRITSIEFLYQKLYEDNAYGKISDNAFMSMSQKNEKEKTQKENELSILKEKIRKNNEFTPEIQHFVKYIRKFMQVNQLTPALVKNLIDKIEVYHVEGTGQNKEQKIRIHYNFIGPMNNEDLISGNVIRVPIREGVKIAYKAIV